jgi:hypothetical protein
MKYVLFIILALNSCGGGTAGTSPTGVDIKRVFSGTVVSDDGQAISNAKIEIDNGDASGTSDNSGRFIFSSHANEESNLKITTDNISSTVKLPKLSSSTSILNLDIRKLSEMFVVTNLELSLESIGGVNCTNLFSPLNINALGINATPLLISDQLVKAEDNVSCFATIAISLNGEPAQGVGTEMYFRSIEYDTSSGNFPTQLVSTQVTNVDGKSVFEFKPNLKIRGSGYFVIETPSSEPFSNRIAVVINPLL